MKLLKIFFAVSFVIWLTYGSLFADGLQGTVAWSNGKTESGELALTPGKDLRIFTSQGQTIVRLQDVREIRFIPESEEMFEGFYFPEPGQPVQKKTGEVYPIRMLKAQIAFNSGQTIEGHLITTMLYLTNDDGTEKIVLLAKQKGDNGEKLADLIYPVTIQFTGTPTSTGTSTIDLSKSGLNDIQHVTCFARPDLTPLQLTPVTGSSSAWTVPFGDSSQLLICVQTADGFHISWPQRDAGAGKDDQTATQAVARYLKLMEDFYDTRNLISCYTDEPTGNTYSIVMMTRVAKSVDATVPHPYSLVLLRWKFDTEAGKAIMLNRVPIVVERLQGNSSLPAVFKEETLFNSIHP